MGTKKKLILAIFLLGSSLAIFGSYLMPAKKPLASVHKTTEVDAIKFCNEIIKDAKDKKPREFISKSTKNPGDVLKECFELLQVIDCHEKSDWKVMKDAANESSFYVTLVRPEKADILFNLIQDNKQWKFNYVTQM